jgi:hypothetical protein
MGDANRELIERFMAASGAGDLDAVGRGLHADMVMEWPQSGERFVGREQTLGAMHRARSASLRMSLAIPSMRADDALARTVKAS